MTPVPFELPIRPAEAAALADLIFDHAGARTLNEDLRSRLAGRAASLKLETVTPWFGTLDRDPVHPSAFYLAVDGQHGEPLLLYIAPASAPSSGYFPRSLLIARMRSSGNREIVVNAVPFGPAERDNICKYAEQVNREFLPRPQGSRPAIVVSSTAPEAVLPEVFAAWREIWKRTGQNLAGLQLDPASWQVGYHAAPGRLAAAVSLDNARAAIRKAAACSKFGIDPVRFPAVACFEDFSSPEEREDLLEQFARSFTAGNESYDLSREAVMAMAARLGPGLACAVNLHDAIRQARVAGRYGRAFDFELLLDAAPAQTSPQELIFCLGWLKARGRAAQLVAPRLPASGTPEELAAAVKPLAAVARQFGATLSMALAGGESAATLEAVGRATLGRVVVTLPGRPGTTGAEILRVAGHLFG